MKIKLSFTNRTLADPDPFNHRIGIPCNTGTKDVNVHKTNSFFRLNFQFVSISKRNVSFYSGIAVIES
jgi:hypothetical protein